VRRGSQWLNRRTITVIGEALIDLSPSAPPDNYHARSGGSPYNVAIGLSRLGQRPSLMARLSDDAFGRILRAHATAEGVGLEAAATADEPTTVAHVSVDDEAQASYTFYRSGTADWQWTRDEMRRAPRDTALDGPNPIQDRYASGSSGRQPSPRSTAIPAVRRSRRPRSMGAHVESLRPSGWLSNHCRSGAAQTLGGSHVQSGSCGR
jgi:sugar/nucleoside kinase (ribokinase family)